MTPLGFVVFCVTNSPNHVNKSTSRVEETLAASLRTDRGCTVCVNAPRLVSNSGAVHRADLLRGTDIHFSQLSISMENRSLENFNSMAWHLTRRVRRPICNILSSFGTGCGAV